MSRELVPEGRYLVKPIEWGITKSKNGDPLLFITFNGAFTDTITSKTWFGTLKEGRGREITLESIITCGFAYGSIDLFDRFDALDKDTEVSIVIGHEEYNGVTKDKVNWVNPVKTLKASADDVKVMLKGLDIKGDLMVAMSKSGVKVKQAPSSPIKRISVPESDDTPF